MIQTLVKNWWLLALCGVLEAIFGFTNVLTQGPDGTLIARTFAGRSDVLLRVRLALAAGICMILAPLWRAREGKCWLLVVNGLALIVLGLTLSGFFGFKISFRAIAVLLAFMAISGGIFEFIAARAFRHIRHFAGEWFLGFAAILSIIFAFRFSVCISLDETKSGFPDTESDLVSFLLRLQRCLHVGSGAAA